MNKLTQQQHTDQGAPMPDVLSQRLQHIHGFLDKENLTLYRRHIASKVVEKWRRNRILALTGFITAKHQLHSQQNSNTKHLQWL